MKRFEAVAAGAFGVVFLTLAVAVAIETAMRKLFNVSLQGVDELGGYCLAIGGALAFAVALQSRAHIRIDIVHERLPRALRVALNVVAVAVLALTALALLHMAWIALSDSMLFQATAQTPWATPLRYPQALWVGALGLFALFALLQAIRVAARLATGKLAELDREFSPRGSKEELREELKDIRLRGVAAVNADAGVRSS
jgi:TRAP-type C4-dicarboxylate transport system permease small subunit